MSKYVCKNHKNRKATAYFKGKGLCRDCWDNRFPPKKKTDGWLDKLVKKQNSLSLKRS